MQRVYKRFSGRDSALRRAVMDLIPHLLWAGVVCYAVSRVADVATLFAPVVDAVPADLVPEVPEDLVALAMTEQEAWAQEETLRAMRERYETLRDWQLVRSAFGVGRRD